MKQRTDGKYTRILGDFYVRFWKAERGWRCELQRREFCGDDMSGEFVLLPDQLEQPFQTLPQGVQAVKVYLCQHPRFIYRLDAGCVL
ncbi:MAG: hypothetical protein WBR15_10905 [Gammaproteobacteria bacterium]